MRRPAFTLLTLVAIGAAAAPVQTQGQTRTAQSTVARTAEREPVVRYQRGRGGDRAEQTDRSVRSVKIGATGELDVSNIAGDIVVTRGGGNEAKIEVVKTARARTDQEAREILPLVQVEITERAGRAEVRTNYPREEMIRDRRNINVSVAYTISAPAGARLTLKSISGDVRVTDITGDLALETVSGDVRVSGGGRINMAKSISGNVEIVETKSEGTLDAGSVSGNLLLQRVKGGRMQLGTVSGNVTLTDVECDRVDAHSMSGDIEFGGSLSKTGRYSLRSHSGNVTVNLASDIGFEVDADSFSGTIRADVPVTTPAMDRNRDPGRPRGRGPRRQGLRGVYGDGSAVLELRTFSGNIVISKR